MIAIPLTTFILCLLAHAFLVWAADSGVVGAGSGAGSDSNECCNTVTKCHSGTHTPQNRGEGGFA